MIVLDTNVVFELMRPIPNQRDMAWVAAQRATNLYTVSITQAEVLHGILLMPAGRRRKDDNGCGARDVQWTVRRTYPWVAGSFDYLSAAMITPTSAPSDA